MTLPDDPAPAAPALALLPGERRALGLRSLAEALDAGLVAAAEADGDPAQSLRIALVEMAGGRFPDAVARTHTVVAASDDPGVQEFAGTLLAFAASWAGRVVPLAVPEPGRDHEPETLLRLALIVQQWTLDDAPRTGRSWAELEALLDRVTDGADRWLREARSVAVAAIGMPAAVFAAFYVVHHTRADWALDYAARLGRLVERHALTAWSGWVQSVIGLAHAMRGDYGTSRDVMRQRLAMLEPGAPVTPSMVIAYAMLFSQAALTGTTLRFESDEVERRLVEGPWRGVGDAAVHAAAGFLALGLASRGDLVGAARMIDHFGPVADQSLEHTMRVSVTEFRFRAALEAADSELSEELLAYAESLFDSPIRIAAVARMRALRGEEVDPVPLSRGTGVALDLVQAHWVRLIAALRYRGRAEALRELAAFDPVAAATGVHGLRARAVALFRPEAAAPSLLTARQREVALFAAAGATNEEIGRRLFLSPRTVEAHIRGALDRLELAGRGQLADAMLPATATGTRLDRLSVRQGQVAALIATGCTNAEIATVLEIAEKTVEQHVAAVRLVLDARNRTGVAAAFLEGRG